MTALVASNEAIREIEQLLYREASFLDKADLNSWFELYTEDGTYWMPAIEGQEDPLNHISLFYDDRVMMEVRRRNIDHPRAASKEYKVRSSHIISNIQVTEQDETTDTCTVTSNFHCLMYYHNKQTAFGGTYTHELAREGGELKIRHKRVDLINCDAVLNTIIIYI